MAIMSFLIILSVLVLVHELGHFIAAKKLKVKVDEFGFGYPPRLLGIKKKGTIYSLNWLPFGGFVRMRGEDLNAGKGSFAKKSKKARLAILLAGISMNFLLGVMLFGAIYTKTGIPEKVNYLLVTQVAVDSPASRAGIKIKDKLVEFNEAQKFIDYINQNRGQAVRLKLSDREVTVMPRLEAETPVGQGALGVGITDVDIVLYPVWQRPFRGMWVGLKEAVLWGKEIVMSLTKINSKNVAGPIGIYQISKAAAKEGWLATLQFMAILSINLAVLNLLPLPALDGGRIFFILIEIIIRKKIKPRIEQAVHMAGMLLLIGLMVLVTIGDIKRLIGS